MCWRQDVLVPKRFGLDVLVRNILAPMRFGFQMFCCRNVLGEKNSAQRRIDTSVVFFRIVDSRARRVDIAFVCWGIHALFSLSSLKGTFAS